MGRSDHEKDTGIKGPEDDKKWIQNMPDWNSSTAWFTIANCVVISLASTGLWYSEGQMVNGTVFYNALVIRFQEFCRYLLSIYGYCAIATGALGIVVAICTNSLNKSRQRTLPERYGCDTAYDVFLTIYLFFAGVMMCVAGIGAAVCTYLLLSATNMPAGCPGTFGLDAPPRSDCGFDSTAYLLLEAAVASNQLASMWAFAQEENYCCGYWCDGTNSSWSCRNNQPEQIWQMESCYQTNVRGTPTCRTLLLLLVERTMEYPMIVGWSAFVLWLLLIAFACQFRVHITKSLKEWVN